MDDLSWIIEMENLWVFQGNDKNRASVALDSDWNLHYSKVFEKELKTWVCENDKKGDRFDVGKPKNIK